MAAPGRTLTARGRLDGAPPPALVAVLVGAVVMAGLGFGVVVLRRSAPSPLNTTAPGRPIEVPAGPSRVPVAGDPVRVRIPAIGVDAPLVPLGLTVDGALEVPRFQDAGWFTGGPKPGDPGPAVIAAHLDSTTGPAVFNRLKDLKRSDQIQVVYADRTVTFLVKGSDTFAKTEFPTGRVYGAAAGPELRLITCTGTFDRATHSYTSNLVVFAMAAPRVA